jgi:hypothetical protein
LTSNGPGAVPSFQAAAGGGGGGLTLGTEQSTSSGTSVNFGSIPAGTKQINIMFEGSSFTAGTAMAIQIGDAGGIETTEYISTSMGVEVGSAETQSSTNQFHLAPRAAAGRNHGIMTLLLKDAVNNTWVATAVINNMTNSTIYSAGTKSLSGELTQVEISGGTFDAGSINISYQ